MSPPIAARVVAAPDLGLAVVGVDAAEVAPTSVALHLFAAGAGVEGVGDEAGPQGVAGVVAGEAGDGCCSLDDLGGAVSSERFEAVKHTVEADEHRVVVGEVSMGRGRPGRRR
jgi:hypothetical protein